MAKINIIFSHVKHMEKVNFINFFVFKKKKEDLIYQGGQHLLFFLRNFNIMHYNFIIVMIINVV